MADVERVQAGPIELSRIAYGTWRMADDPEAADPLRYRSKVETLLDLGVTTFDHADLYGDYTNEAAFGAAVTRDRNLRKKLEIVTKCAIKQPGAAHPDYRIRHYDLTYDHIIASAESSLRKLSTDYLDLLLLHRFDPLLDADESARALDQLVESGKVRAVGVSNFNPSQVDLLRSRLKAPLAVHQIKLSLATPEALHDGLLDQCQQHRIQPMAYSPLGGDLLFGSPPQAPQLAAHVEAMAARLGVHADQLALAWVLALPTKPIVLLGSHRTDRLTRQITAAMVHLDRQNWYDLWRASTGRL
jgi:predicted oxidoreductase